jgi:hypothetical protein
MDGFVMTLGKRKVVLQALFKYRTYLKGLPFNPDPRS